MKILLDTHIFLWLISGDARLPKRMIAPLQDPMNRVFLSVVSVWEAMVKNGLGKLPLPQAPEMFLPAERERHGIISLQLGEKDLLHLPSLPPLHRDPFDRMLLCQAKQHNCLIATLDVMMLSYSLPTL